MNRFSLLFVLFPVLLLAFQPAARAEAELEKSLCIETSEGCTRVLERGVALPASYSQTFSNIEDRQHAVQIAVYQGEAASLDGNRLIGSFDIPIASSNEGEAQIQVTIMVDVAGKLSVNAHDLSSGKKQEFFGGVVQ